MLDLKPLSLSLPDWLTADSLPNRVTDDTQGMRLAIDLARKNVERQTGGPFGAVIFSHLDGKLVSVGVNRVTACHDSSAHAEIVSLRYAQRALQSFNLNSTGAKYTVATSSQPCAQCIGALIWSGVTRVLIGATAADVENIAGFDEGPIHPQWKQEYAKRNIEVVEDLLREEACAVLGLYKSAGGLIYNGTRST